MATIVERNYEIKNRRRAYRNAIMMTKLTTSPDWAFFEENRKENFLACLDTTFSARAILRGEFPLPAVHD